MQTIELGLFDRVPDDAVWEGLYVLGIPAGVVQAVQVTGVAGVIPPAALIRLGAVNHVQVVIAVRRAERHAVMVTQRIAWWRSTNTYIYFLFYEILWSAFRFTYNVISSLVNTSRELSVFSLYISRDISYRLLGHFPFVLLMAFVYIWHCYAGQWN